MRALRVGAYGEPADVLEVQEVASPEPGPGQVRVRVAAAALNFPDVNLCRGIYHLRPPLPFTPGMEACGTVVELGEGVSADLMGQRVVGVPDLPHGALAEESLLAADRVHVVPDGIDDAAAASTFIAFTTAHVALKRRAGLEPGETLVVLAAAGGTGSAAVQLGHVLGARVIAVAGSPSKAAACRALGADCFIDSSNEDVVARVQQETDGQGADIIFDPVGGAAFEEARHYVAVDGRILVVGFASGEIPAVRVNSVLYRSYSIMGVYVGAYKREADRAYLKRVYGELDELMTEGRLRPLIARRITLEQVPAALEDLAARRVVGKVVVHPDGPSSSSPHQEVDLESEGSVQP